MIRVAHAMKGIYWSGAKRLLAEGLCISDRERFGFRYARFRQSMGDPTRFPCARGRRGVHRYGQHTSDTLSGAHIGKCFRQARLVADHSQLPDTRSCRPLSSALTYSDSSLL